MADASSDTSSGTHTQRALGTVRAILVVTGNMIGSGVYLLPALTASVGGISVLAWLAALIVAVLVALTLSWLFQIEPSAEDGLIRPITRALGEGPGYQIAFLYWVSAWVGNVAIALAVVGYAGYFVAALLTPIAATAALIGVIWFAVAVSAIGPRFVGSFSGLSLFIGLIPILAVAILGWRWFDPALYEANWIQTDQAPIVAVSATVVPVFWAFAGLESTAIAARVVKNPAKNMTLVTVVSILFAGAVYMLATSAILGLLPAASLVSSSSPFADATARVLGGSVAAVIAVCAMVKALGTLTGWVLVTAQAAEFEGQSILQLTRARTAEKVNASAKGHVVSGILMTGAALITLNPVLSHQFASLIDVSVLLILMTYIAAGFALLRLAPRLPLAQRTATLAAIVACTAMFFTMDARLWAWIGGLVALAALLQITRALLRPSQKEKSRTSP